MRHRLDRPWLAFVALFLLGTAGAVRADDAAPPPSREQIEADWLRQDAVRDCGPVTREQDAAGACDGVKNGQWGFHTALEDDPWWQIDLGEPRPLDHLTIYNRCDHTAGRAAQLTVSLSQDGKVFESFYQHDGTMFLGQPDGKPLQVRCEGRTARYVRLQVPGNNCLHLDEVEIVVSDGSDNVALGRPATQSSVCEWSTRKDVAQGGSYPTLTVIQQGQRLAGSLQRLAQYKTRSAPSPTSSAGISCEEEIRTLDRDRSRPSSDCRLRRPSPTGGNSISVPAPWCAGSPWLTRSWISTIWCWSAAPRENGRICRISTWVGGRSPAAACTSCMTSRPTTRSCSA